jgi:hypothetical protein
MDRWSSIHKRQQTHKLHHSKAKKKKTNTKRLTKRSTAKKKNRQTHTHPKQKKQREKKKKRERERERRFFCDLMMKSGYMHLLCLFCLLSSFRFVLTMCGATREEFVFRFSLRHCLPPSPSASLSLSLSLSPFLPPCSGHLQLSFSHVVCGLWSYWETTELFTDQDPKPTSDHTQIQNHQFRLF